MRKLFLITFAIFIIPSQAQAITINNIYHWKYHTIWIEDHTRIDRWPVYVAVRSWDLGTDVRVRYGKCREGAGCIRVREGYYGDTHWAGLTYIILSGRIIVKAWVKLNDTYVRFESWRTQRMITCHEIGHGLGLWYNRKFLASKSCMYGYANPSVYLPSAGDKYWLNRVY